MLGISLLRWRSGSERGGICTSQRGQLLLKVSHFVPTGRIDFKMAQDENHHVARLAPGSLSTENTLVWTLALLTMWLEVSWEPP
jgi:hypothetical protein